MGDAVRTGLQSTPKYLPTWFRYDKETSQYYSDVIQKQQDYYFPRTEMSLLHNKIEEICPKDDENTVLIDFGSGNCEKSRLLIDVMLKRQKSVTFYPIDISKEFLYKCADDISNDYGRRVTVHPIAGDYNEGIKFVRSMKSQPKILIWFSTLQNESVKDQTEYVRLMSELMTDKCRLIVSLDITQDEDKIMSGYYKGEGVYDIHCRLATQIEERKMLFLKTFDRLNREYNANIALENITVHGEFVRNESTEKPSFMRVWLEVQEPISTYIDKLGITLSIQKNERVYLHHGEALSCKYTMEQIEYLVRKSGLCLHRHWEDDKRHVTICSILKSS